MSINGDDHNASRQGAHAQTRPEAQGGRVPWEDENSPLLEATLVVTEGLLHEPLRPPDLVIALLLGSSECLRQTHGRECEAVERMLPERDSSILAVPSREARSARMLEADDEAAFERLFLACGLPDGPPSLRSHFDTSDCSARVSFYGRYRGRSFSVLYHTQASGYEGDKAEAWSRFMERLLEASILSDRPTCLLLHR